MTSKFFVRHNDQPLYSLVSIINTGNLWNRTPYFLPLSSATPHKARYYLLYDHFIRNRHHCLHMTKKWQLPRQSADPHRRGRLLHKTENADTYRAKQKRSNWSSKSVRSFS